MNNEELKTLLDIQNSNDFRDLQSRTAIRLGGVQRNLASEGYYDGTWKEKHPLFKQFAQTERKI